MELMAILTIDQSGSLNFILKATSVLLSFPVVLQEFDV